MDRTAVPYRVRGVEPQAIDVVLVHPVQCVLDEEPSHLAAPRSVEVDATAPRALVSIGEVVLAEQVRVSAVRPKMVVDDVEVDRDPVLMRRIHERAEIIGLAV